nr:methyltransferase [Bradyrhizobium uaiense]
MLTIDHVGHRGDGVATDGTQPIFVPYTLAGETVEVEDVPGHHPDRRRLVRVTQESPERITPFCPHFGVCGGCAIQHWNDASYHAWKRNIVVETLAQAKIAADVAPLLGAHGVGRRRITLHGRIGAHEGLNGGFAAVGSHDIGPGDSCPSIDPARGGALEAACAGAEARLARGTPPDADVNAAPHARPDEARGSGELPTRLISTLSRVAEKHRLARLTRHGELVLQRASPEIAIGKAKVVLPPGSFLQATVKGEETLAALARERCGRAKHIADLFCGVGPFALRLAEKARIAAFDNDAGAIAALQKAAQTTPGLKPLKAEARDLFRRPLMPQELRDYDAVVFDPPRQGAQAQVTQLAASKVPVIVAVSCNAATFARDAKILIDGGYKISDVTPVDQFRHTPHVELVARFAR